MEGEYISWLEKKKTRFSRAAGTCWILYQGALVPASPFPSYLKLSSGEARFLLKESGAWLIRYSSGPSNCETSWWNVVCDNYDPALISAKTRQNIKRGNRECIVQEVDAEWIADHGYPCYSAAFGRYQDRRPAAEEEFRENVLDTSGGPFSYWAVFYKGLLAGYCQCIVDGKQAATNITKYDPTYLRHRSAYALMDKLIQTYVTERGMVLSNGSRSISHNTNYQEVLISLGFRKQFCRLNIIYSPWLKLGVEALYPMRSLIDKLPDRHIIHKVGALLFQEELRRACKT
jgi:hypothetical protein